MYKGTKKLASTYKYIDSEKAKRYIVENHVNMRALSNEAGYSDNAMSQSIKRGFANKAMWRLLCMGLGVPEDYFDIKEPVPEPEPMQEVPEEDKSDMADIQLSLNKIELILTKMFDVMEAQNRLLRGRLEKAERSAETRGATNSGEPHSFMVRKEVI